MRKEHLRKIVKETQEQAMSQGMKLSLLDRKKPEIDDNLLVKIQMPRPTQTKRLFFLIALKALQVISRHD